MSSHTPVDATRVEDVDQLVTYLDDGGKDPDHWRVGVEHEKIGWWPDRGKSPTYEGERGIGQLLETLAHERGWTPSREGDAIVALKRDGASITLEPGGQMELSGAPLASLAANAAELDAHFEEIRSVSESFGLTWSGLGLAPAGDPDRVAWMPKARYVIMRRYLPTRGRLAKYMMGLTCTVQANYDFADAEDAMRKLRVGLRLQPLVIGLFANSPIVGGELTPYRSFRAAVWEEVDDDRCWLPARFYEPGATLRDYVDWAMGVPMFFVVRDGAYVDCAGLPFRDFMEHGLEGQHVTMGDWELHLSTLFPDVRLKHYMEVRGADMGDRDHVMALPTFHKGLLYDSAALDAVDALLAPFGGDSVLALRRSVPREGLDARIGTTCVKELATDVLRYAREGLERIEPESAHMLDVLDANLAENKSPADRVRETWNGDVGRLIAQSRVC